MGGLITDLVSILLETLVWVFGMLTNSLLRMTTLSENGFSDTFSNSLLGPNGLYYSESANAMFPKTGDQILSILEGVALCFIVLMMTFQLMRSMFIKDYRPDSPLRIVGRGMIFGFIIMNYKLIVDTLIGGVFAPIYKTAEEQEDIANTLVGAFSDIGRSTTVYAPETVAETLGAAGDALLELFLSKAVFIVSLIKIIVVVHLLVKFMALALEVIERFVEMFFLTMFGPLCIAVGFNPRSKVFGNWLAFFIDGYVLMAINILMTKLSLVAIMNFLRAFNKITGAGPAELVVSLVINHGSTEGVPSFGSVFVKWAATYATIKIGCEFDDIMNNLGFKVAQAGGIENNGLFASILGGALFRKLRSRFAKSLAGRITSTSRGAGSAVANTVGGGTRTGVLGFAARGWATTPVFRHFPNPWAALAGVGAKMQSSDQGGIAGARQGALKKLNAASQVDRNGIKAFGAKNADVWATMSAVWQSQKTGALDNAGLANMTKAMNKIGVAGTAIATELSGRNGAGRAVVTMKGDDGRTSRYTISNKDLGNANAYMNANGEIWGVSSYNNEGIQKINEHYQSTMDNSSVEALFVGLDASSNIANFEVDTSKIIDISSRVDAKGDYVMLKDTGELVRMETDKDGNILYSADSLVSYTDASGNIYQTDVSNFVNYEKSEDPLRFKADDVFVLYETTDVSQPIEFSYFKVGDKIDTQKYKLAQDENGNVMYRGSSLAVDFSQLKNTKLTKKEQLVHYGAPIAFFLAKENGEGQVKKVKADYGRESGNNAVISIKNISTEINKDGQAMSMCQTKAGALVEVAQAGRTVKDGKVYVPVAVNPGTGMVNVKQQNGHMTAMSIPQIQKSGMAKVTDDGYMEIESHNARVQLFAQKTKDENDNDVYTVYGEDGKTYTVDGSFIRKQIVPVWNETSMNTIVVTKGKYGKPEQVALSDIERDSSGNITLYALNKEGKAFRSKNGNYIKTGDEYKPVDDSCVGYEVMGFNTQTYISGGEVGSVGVAVDESGKVHIDTEDGVCDYGSGKYGFKTKESDTPVIMSVERDLGEHGAIEKDRDRSYSPVHLKYGSKGSIKMETLSSYSADMYGEESKDILRSVLEDMTDDSRIEIKDVRTNDLQSSGIMTTKETDPDNYGEITKYDWYDAERYNFEELIKKARKTEEEEEMIRALEKAKKKISEGNVFYRMKADKQTKRFMSKYFK